MTSQSHLYIGDRKLRCSPAAVKADKGFSAICREFQIDGGIMRRESYDRGRSLSGANCIIAGVVSRKGMVHVAYEELITDYQVTPIRNGIHIPSGVAIRVSVVEALVQIIGFTDDVVVVQFIAGVVLGNVLPVSRCIIHAHVDAIDAASYGMLRDADGIAQAPSKKFSSGVEYCTLMLSFCTANDLI